MDATHLDATLLAPATTADDIEALCRVARALGCAGACVPPLHVARAAEMLQNCPVRPGTVINFPLGADVATTCAAAARSAVADGAQDVDLVVPLAAVATSNAALVRAHVAAVRDAIGAAPGLRAILECAAFTAEHIACAAEAAMDGGADWLKTSTGFHPAGGASVAAVELLATLARPGVRVKASGGIRTRAEAEAMIAAGATLIGTSAPAALCA